MRWLRVTPRLSSISPAAWEQAQPHSRAKKKQHRPCLIGKGFPDDINTPCHTSHSRLSKRASAVNACSRPASCRSSTGRRPRPTRRSTRPANLKSARWPPQQVITSGAMSFPKSTIWIPLPWTGLVVLPTVRQDQKGRSKLPQAAAGYELSTSGKIPGCHPVAHPSTNNQESTQNDLCRQTAMRGQTPFGHGSLLVPVCQLPERCCRRGRTSY